MKLKDIDLDKARAQLAALRVDKKVTTGIDEAIERSRLSMVAQIARIRKNINNVSSDLIECRVNLAKSQHRFPVNKIKATAKTQEIEDKALLGKTHEQDKQWEAFYIRLDHMFFVKQMNCTQVALIINRTASRVADIRKRLEHIRNLGKSIKCHSTKHFPQSHKAVFDPKYD